jgi:hypothetical protein
MWKLEVMALFVPLYRYVAGETEKNYKNLRSDSGLKSHRYEALVFV